MGTRCLTEVYDGEDLILRLYRQYDGYPEDHGKELATFICPINFVNGFVSAVPKENQANGVGCFAAQLVAHFKTEPGSFYIESTKDEDLEEEFVYKIYTADRMEDLSPLCYIKSIEVKNNKKIIFEGSRTEFLKFCDGGEGSET